MVKLRFDKVRPRILADGESAYAFNEQAVIDIRLALYELRAAESELERRL